jgi:trimethylamine--corrinoid protein Co-methyltransferase
MRAHQSKAGLIDRRVREEWEMDGSTNLYDRCTEKAKELVENHVVEPLPSDVVDEIRSIVRQVEKSAGVA